MTRASGRHNPGVTFDCPVAGLAPSLRSRMTERIIGSRSRLARLRGGRALELYYEAGDAHSQLCAALARRLLPRLNVPLQVLLVPAPDGETYPEEQRQRRFAATDAARLAPCHDLPAPRAVAEDWRAAMQARLAAAGRDAQAFLDAEQACLSALARGESPGATSAADAARTPALLHANSGRRRRLGHYLPAMWQYRGEWFWALDRLEFLRARLLADRALSDGAPLTAFDARRLPQPPPVDGVLEFWFSFRSPYSYLAAVQLLRRRASYGEIAVRPVLPMVMRGLPVPRVKRLYVVRDATRCADALGIPFGRIHDPAGEGTLRLLTAHPYDAGADTQLRFCAVAGQTIWAEGLDVRRDDVLRSIVERSGLDWRTAQRRLARGYDTREAEAHHAALLAAGLWGVPGFRRGSFTTWGQDRLWMLER